MINIEILNLRKNFKEIVVLDHLNLYIYPEQINVILGPSGCGKSTLLNIIAGLDSKFTGTIKGIKSHKTSYIFQDDSLLEWRSIKNNILFALSGKVDSGLLLNYGNALGLSNYWNHYPSQLSGGLRQRVNILRGLLYPSTLMLMDEPFKSLDTQTKEEVINLFLQIQQERKLTTILVTHNLEEALQVGHYIHVLSQKPTHIVDTFTNPYFSLDKSYSYEDKKTFLNQIKEIMKF